MDKNRRRRLYIICASKSCLELLTHVLVRDMSKRRARPDMYARRVTVLLQYAGGVIAIVHACDAQGLLPVLAPPG